MMTGSGEGDALLALASRDLVDVDRASAPSNSTIPEDVPSTGSSISKSGTWCSARTDTGFEVLAGTGTMAVGFTGGRTNGGSATEGACAGAEDCATTRVEFLEGGRSLTRATLLDSAAA